MSDVKRSDASLAKVVQPSPPAASKALIHGAGGILRGKILHASGTGRCLLPIQPAVAPVEGMKWNVPEHVEQVFGNWQFFCATGKLSEYRRCQHTGLCNFAILVENDSLPNMRGTECFTPSGHHRQ